MATTVKKVKRSSRERSKFRIRRHIMATTNKPRISVFRSGKHTYAQVVSDVDGKTIAAASTLDSEVKSSISSVSREGLHGEAVSTKSVLAAKAVGVVLAKRSIEKNVSAVVFDRNGFVFKGRVRALAEGLREGGLQF